jgi:hypothetical protein
MGSGYLQQNPVIFPEPAHCFTVAGNVGEQQVPERHLVEIAKRRALKLGDNFPLPAIRRDEKKIVFPVAKG